MSSSPTHIVIACSYLHVPGGYEKAMVTTANLFAKKGHRVTVLILDHTAEIYYPLDKRVGVVHQPMNFGITKKGNTILRKIWLSRDIRKLKKILYDIRPTHLICTEYPFVVAAIAAGARKITRVYSWEHHHYKAQSLNSFWKFLSGRAYKKLDAVICLNPDEQRYYTKHNKNTVVIPNFIQPVNHPNSIKNFSIISVTRFNHIKGIDLLMDTAKKLLPGQPQIKWKVIGYGEQKDIFLDFIKKEGLTGQLIYQAVDKPDITKDYQEASLFVMTSRNECFPLVLLEAMNNGLPCISFDCDTGPRHIIRQNKTGVLVESGNTDELCEAIRGLLNDRNKMNLMSENARIEIKKYYPDTIYLLWQRLLNI